jgi:hypothetical protein
LKIEFIGGARTVTGSQHLLHINGKKFFLSADSSREKEVKLTTRIKTSNLIRKK